MLTTAFHFRSFLEWSIITSPIDIVSFEIYSFLGKELLKILFFRNARVDLTFKQRIGICLVDKNGSPYEIDSQ